MLFSTKKEATPSVEELSKLTLSDPFSAAKDTSPIDWKPDFFRAWPLKEGEDLPDKPWGRPEQLPMSFVGESLDLTINTEPLTEDPIGVNIIDVESSKILPNMTVKIKGGEMVYIGKAKNTDMQESGYSSIDASGLYMCPGLIDCK
jgi:hypothetical protein